MPLFLKEANFAAIIDNFIHQFGKSDIFPEDIRKEINGYYAIIREHYPWHDTDKVSSHNDLNPNNILCDGKKIWIIDWEAAFQNDRYVDLAIVANSFVTNEAQENLFLGAYFGNTLDAYKISRFFLMRQVCRLLYGMLMFKLASTVKLPGTPLNTDIQTLTLKEVGEQLRSGKILISSYNGQCLYGKALLNEALNNMRLPRFRAAIEFLAGTT